MLNVSATGNTSTSRASTLLNLAALNLPSVPNLPMAPLDLASSVGSLLRDATPALGLLDSVDAFGLLGTATTAATNTSAISVGSLDLPATVSPAALLGGLPLVGTGTLSATTLLDTLMGALPTPSLGNSTLPTPSLSGLLSAAPNLPVLDAVLPSQIPSVLGNLDALVSPGDLVGTQTGDLSLPLLNLANPSLMAGASAASTHGNASANADAGALGTLLSITSQSAAEPAALLNSVVSQLKLLG